MSDESMRKVCFHAVLVILLGLLAGFPLLSVVAREVYHHADSLLLPGDYRGWRMAHLEGVFNGLLMIGLAAATRVQPMSIGRQRWLVWAMIVSGWGNAIGSVLAPLVRQRGMIITGVDANSAVAAVFTVALVGTVLSFFLLLRHLGTR